MSLTVYAAVVIASVCFAGPNGEDECRDLSAVYLAEKPFVPNAFGTSELHENFNDQVCSQLKMNTWSAIDGTLNTPETKKQGVKFEIRKMKCIFSAESFFNEYLTKKLQEDNDAKND